MEDPEPKEDTMMDYNDMRENAAGWQRRAYRAEAKLSEIRATVEYWQSDSPRLPQALRQGAATILALLNEYQQGRLP